MGRRIGICREPDPEDAWVALALVPGIDPGRLARLVAWSGGDPVAAVRALPTVFRPGGPRAGGFRQPLPAPADLIAAARRERARLEAAGARAVTRGSADYPPALERLPDPPPVLFVAGTLPAGTGVAVVGSRAATPGGRRFAEDLATSLAACGLPLVSGLARGIDAAAHEGALAAGGPTIAVLGSGLDRVYPPEHAALASRIRAAGALVTEWPLGTPPLAWHFPRRNRLLAALSRAVVVVEAGERSGALITARHALDLGVDVLAVPGPPGAPLARGTHALIRDGAGLVEGPEDVLAAIGVQPPPAACALGSPLPGGVEGAGDCALVLAALADGPASLDAVAARCGLGAGAVAAALLRLELAGLVDSPSGQIYSARPPRRPRRVGIGGSGCGSGSSTS